MQPHTESRIESAAESPLAQIRTNNLELRRLVEYARQVATTPYSVLIQGETGTGKEVFARGIHAASGRGGPFVPINCSAVPENMFEAELFGARRGAYTGLVNERPGLFVVADKGTLFLDEVAELPTGTQAKLLRVLEDGVIRPIGGTEWMRVNVRVVAATHKSLEPLVEKGQFRSDLYFRLSATAIRLPPIRERPEDLSQLLDEALVEACRQQQVEAHTLDPSALEVLLRYAWPGNVRELKNTLAAAVLRSTTGVVRVNDLPAAVRSQEAITSLEDYCKMRFFDALERFEEMYIASLLRRSEGNLSRAARMAGLSRGTVRNKARRYHLIEGGEDGESTRRSRVRRPSR